MLPLIAAQPAPFDAANEVVVEFQRKSAAIVWPDGDTGARSCHASQASGEPAAFEYAHAAAVVPLDPVTEGSATIAERAFHFTVPAVLAA